LLPAAQRFASRDFDAVAGVGDIQGQVIVLHDGEFSGTTA
jgi:hypothetical protein